KRGAGHHRRPFGALYLRGGYPEPGQSQQHRHRPASGVRRPERLERHQPGEFLYPAVNLPEETMIEGVIFDLDGVLVTTDDCHYEAWKRMADEEGMPFDREVNRRLRGVSRMESLDIILENAGRVYSGEERTALAKRKNAYYVD